MKKICVFCGSSGGKSSFYRDKAKELGELLVDRNIGLVYGGASIGVMGAVADSVLENGGQVWGVIPKSIMELEVGHQGLTELIIVDSMHERKKRMYDLSDAFFTLPGGFGTLDELCEILTWAQLGYHRRPCYLINDQGFYGHLLQHFRLINKEGFLSDDHLALLNVFSRAEEAIDHFTKF